jgi:hypothetical protein
MGVFQQLLCAAISSSTLCFSHFLSYHTTMLICAQSHGGVIVIIRLTVRTALELYYIGGAGGTLQA